MHNTDGEQAVLNAVMKIEMAAEITAILAETDPGKAASAIAAFQLQLEERMQGEGDSEAANHAEMMSQRIQEAWITLRQHAKEA